MDRFPLKSKNIDCQEVGCERKATTDYRWYNGLGMEMGAFLCDECCDVVDARLYPKLKLDELESSGRCTPEQEKRFVDYVISKLPLAETATIVCMRCGKRRPLLEPPDPCDCQRESEPHQVSEPCTCGECEQCTFYEKRGNNGET